MASMRTIGVRLRLLTGSYKQDADEAAKSTDKLGDAITKSGKKSQADLDGLATKMGIVGGALLGVAAAAVVAAAGFDKQMSEVGAVANASAGDMDKLRQAALDAGAATVFSAKDAAEAEAELAKAGILTADILGGALNGSLALASAGSLDLARSAEIAAAAMNTFGLGGEDVGHIADVLAAAANTSAAGVDDLGQGLQQVGLVAAQVGMSLEETVAVLAAFADRGLRGSDGATSLKTALQRLSAPTDVAKATMDELGISMYDANGQMVDITDVAGQLQRGLKDLAPAQRNAALQTIFGSDAIRAANILYAEGEGGIQDYIAAVDDEGAAARMAADKLDNLSGDVEALTGSLETLFISSGEGANGALRVLTQGATELVNAFAALPGPVQTAGVVLVGATGIILLTGAAVIKLGKATADLKAQMVAQGPVGARMAGGLESVTRASLKTAAALGVLALATAAAEGFDDWSVDADGLADSLQRLGREGKASGELTRQFGDDMKGAFDAFNATDNPFAGPTKGAEALIPGLRQLNREWLAGSPSDYADQVASVDDSLSGLVRGGHLEEARAAVYQLMQVTNLSYDEILERLPKFRNANLEAQKTTEDQAAAAKVAAADNVRLAGAFGAAASEVDGLKDAFDALNGAELSWRDAERKAEQAVDDLTQAMIDSNGSLDVHDEKGRAAAAAVDALAEAAAVAAQKNYDQTQSVEAANAVYGDYVDQLKATLLNADIAADVVDTLVASITKMPAYKAVTLDVVETHRSYWSDYRAGERQRWGGITDHGDPLIHAATGALSQASMFSAGPTRYAFAEPQTGGEAFVPKRGNYGRSMGILSAAAGWYNADVVPRNGWYDGAGGTAAPSGAGSGEVTVNVLLDGQAIEPRMVKVVTDRDRATKRRVQAGHNR